MVKAYILIELMAGHSSRIVQTLNSNHSVIEADRVTGPYDVIAVIEAANLEEVSSVISRDIHSLKGIVHTTTSISFT